MLPVPWHRRNRNCIISMMLEINCSAIIKTSFTKVLDNKVIDHVYLTLDCKRLLASLTQSVITNYVLTDEIVVFLHRLPFRTWCHSVILVQLSLLRSPLAVKGEGWNSAWSTSPCSFLPSLRFVSAGGYCTEKGTLGAISAGVAEREVGVVEFFRRFADVFLSWGALRPCLGAMIAVRKCGVNIVSV